jgi:hypothetical protein
MATSNARRSNFVAMPFKRDYDPVLDTIKSAADLLGMDTIQLGEESFTGSIASKIRSAIEDCDVVTAIVTEENGNVYYEIGLAHCKQKPVVLLTSDPNTVKFDLRDHRSFVYDCQHPERMKDRLVRTIATALRAKEDAATFLISAFGHQQGLPPDLAGADAVGRAAERGEDRHLVTLTQAFAQGIKESRLPGPYRPSDTDFDTTSRHGSSLSAILC